MGPPSGLRPPNDFTDAERRAFLTATKADREWAAWITNELQLAAYRWYVLLAEAHDKMAHAILGMTWEGYVRHNFDRSRQWAYYKLHQARVVKALEEVAGVPVLVNERQARRIKPTVLADVVTFVRDGIDAGHEPADVVQAAIAIWAVPSNAQARRIVARVPEVAAAVYLLTGVRPDTDSNAYTRELAALNHMVEMARGAPPSKEVAVRLTDEGREQLNAVFDAAEAWIATARRRVNNTPPPAIRTGRTPPP